jgi:hypothetical protein
MIVELSRDGWRLTLRSVVELRILHILTLPMGGALDQSCQSALTKVGPGDSSCHYARWE